MSRDEAIQLARSAAVARPAGHSYIPIGKLPDDWMPHEWVIDAILCAAGPTRKVAFTDYNLLRSVHSYEN